MPDSGLSFIIIFSSAITTLVTLYFIILLIVDIFKGRRKFKGNGLKGIITLLLSFSIMGGIAYCLYYIPDILYSGFSWTMIYEYGPEAIINAVLSLSVVIPTFYLYFILAYYFVNPDEKPFFLIIVLSIVSGFGNSLMVFIINAALNRTLNDASRSESIESGLYIYFLLGVLLFTVSTMIVRKRLITLTSTIVYEKRIDIINRILKAPYHKFEVMESGKTQAALNNDTENVSGFVNMFVNGFTGSISMIVCFIYLGTLNLYGALFSILIIIFAAGLFMFASQSAHKLFEKNRDAQNIFFKYINDLISGFKELYINPGKRYEFYEDIQDSCKVYKDTRIGGEFRFVGVTVIGEILYLSVIGMVVFTFPLIFNNIQGNILRTYVLVYLYMGGVVNMLLYLIPGLIRVRVSWKRINEYIKDISLIEDDGEKIADSVYREAFSIQLKGVKFQYKSENGERFTLGPIDYCFKSGEVVFISGGNGSGKSTLAKLITGLYDPDEGKITVNGEKTSSKLLGSYFTTVYSDYYLFEKLYGVDCDDKKEEINRYLKILRIDDKVTINNGAFSTIKLSAGQRKRLALLISYLEDRPAFFFDEWAADQDPEFRKFFYRILIPELKNRGKAVIVISHDDRYFDEADKLIRMETGRITGREDLLESNYV